MSPVPTAARILRVSQSPLPLAFAWRSVPSWPGAGQLWPSRPSSLAEAI